MARPRAKQRVTYRLSLELTGALRQIPNQTAFVEAALRDALARLCPLCHGTGEAPGVHLAVSDLKHLRDQHGPRLGRSAAAQLKALVRLGRQLLATELRLLAPEEGEGLAFRLARENEVLLSGRITEGGREPRLTH